MEDQLEPGPGGLSGHCWVWCQVFKLYQDRFHNTVIQIIVLKVHFVTCKHEQCFSFLSQKKRNKQFTFSPKAHSLIHIQLKHLQEKRHMCFHIIPPRLSTSGKSQNHRMWLKLHFRSVQHILNRSSRCRTSTLVSSRRQLQTLRGWLFGNSESYILSNLQRQQMIIIIGYDASLSLVWKKILRKQLKLLSEIWFGSFECFQIRHEQKKHNYITFTSLIFYNNRCLYSKSEIPNLSSRSSLLWGCRPERGTLWPLSNKARLCCWAWW